MAVRNDQAVKLIFELTNVCNFDCAYCIREETGDRQYLSVDLLSRVLDEAKRYGIVDYVALTGGEPTIHPSFGSVLSHIAERGFKCGFVTNGWHFRDRVVPHLSNYQDSLEAVTFSLDGATADVHDTLRMRKGSYTRVIQAAQYCRSREWPFQINCVVTTSNRSQISEMALLAARLGCDRLLFGHCQPTPAAVDGHHVLTAEERIDVESEVARLQSELRMPVLLAGDHFTDSRYHQCDQLRLREMNVDHRGYLTACCMLSGFRGGTTGSEIVADLNTESLFEGHKKLLRTVFDVNLEKIDRVEADEHRLAYRSMCSHCLERFGKVRDIALILGTGSQELQ